MTWNPNMAMMQRRFGQRGRGDVMPQPMPRGRLGDTGRGPPDFRGGSFDTGGLAGSLRGDYGDVDMEAVRGRLENMFQGGGFDPMGMMRGRKGGRFGGMQRSPYGGQSPPWAARSTLPPGFGGGRFNRAQGSTRGPLQPYRAQPSPSPVPQAPMQRGFFGNMGR